MKTQKEIEALGIHVQEHGKGYYVSCGQRSMLVADFRTIDRADIAYLLGQRRTVATEPRFAYLQGR